MSWSLRHPSRRRLAAWLDDVDGDRLGGHLDGCARCARRLDELADDATDDVVAASFGTSFGVAVREAWRVPEQLPDRIHRAIDRHVAGRRELDLLLGLVSVGADTLALLLPSDPSEEDADVEEEPS